MANLLAELQQQPQQRKPVNLLAELQQPAQQLTAQPIQQPQLAQQGAVQNVNIPSVIDSGALPVDRVQPIKVEPETTIGEDITTGLQTAATIGRSAIAEPIAGVIGGVEAAGRGFLNLIGFDTGDAVAEGVETIGAVRDFITGDPGSEESKKQLQAIGEFIAPAAETFAKVESTLGNAVLDATGSPALAAIAHSLPTAALQAIGVKGLKGSKLNNVRLSGNVGKAITQAAPDIKTIKAKATQAYNDLDNLGIRVKPEVFEGFASRLSAKLTKEGIDNTLHPKATAALNKITGDIGLSKRPSELETLRKVAKDAASSIDRADARLGNIIVNEIDNALDSLSTQIGGKFKEARALSQRAFKSQAVTDMIENASHTASGMENGLRIEARKILKNKKKRRGFTKDELSALRQIEQGTTASNTAKFLGKFGISEGQATSMLGASIGIGGGGAIGAAFGPAGAAIGALTVPAIGQLAKNTAQRLTLKSTKFADDLSRAGKNSKEITKAYLKHTSKANRNVSDLTDLLLDTNIKPSDIRASSSSVTGKLIADATHFANEIKRRAKQAGSAALITQPELKEPK